MNTYIINQKPNIVEAHSNFRIPFEPKGVQLSMRNELREKIRCLTIKENEILKASFYSVNDVFYDVENILIYNIGYDCFKNLTENGFIIEKSQSPLFQNNDSKNHYRYEVVDKNSLEVVNPIKLIDFSYKLNKLNTSTKAFEHFYSFKDARFKTYSNSLNMNQNIGIHIKIESNAKLINPVNLIKPMIDGIISGLHYDTSLSSDAKEKLTILFGIPITEIDDMFCETPITILGKRSLVSTFRNGIKWNPEDERCVDIRVEPMVNNSFNRIKISGHIYSIIKRPIVNGISKQYYNVIQEYHSKYKSFRFQIDWNTYEISGTRNSSGYIVQKVYISRPYEVSKKKEITYYEAWKIENGKYHRDKNSPCDDEFSLSDKYFPDDYLKSSIGISGQAKFSGKVYWVSTTDPVYSDIDKWKKNNVPEAGVLKSVYKFEKLTCKHFVFTRPPVSHSWDLTSDESIYEVVKLYIKQRWGCNIKKASTEIKRAIDYILCDNCYDSILDKIEKEFFK